MDLAVACVPRGTGWTCQVAIGDDVGATRHEVGVEGSLLARLRPGAADPTELVRASFEFLLAREPRESILPAFDLELIARYVPDWESAIGR